MLGDFHLLHHLTQGGTVTGTIFTHNSNLLGALGLRAKKKPLNTEIRAPDRRYIHKRTLATIISTLKQRMPKIQRDFPSYHFDCVETAEDHYWQPVQKRKCHIAKLPHLNSIFHFKKTLNSIANNCYFSIVNKIQLFF